MLKKKKKDEPSVDYKADYKEIEDPRSRSASLAVVDLISARNDRNRIWWVYQE